MKITDERFEEIKAAEKAALDGPWNRTDNDDGTVNISGHGNLFLESRVIRCTPYGLEDSNEADFIIIARTAIPELLAEREEREKEIERLEGTRLKGGGMKVLCPACYNINPYPSLDCLECGENLRMALVVTHVVALKKKMERLLTRAESVEEALEAVREVKTAYLYSHDPGIGAPDNSAALAMSRICAILDARKGDPEIIIPPVRDHRCPGCGLEALREWALTARRLWGGGGGVHWKSFYAILDGKGG